MSARGSFPRSVALSTAILGLLVAPGLARAQGSAPAPLRVEVQAIGSTGVAGIALLGPAPAGTAVQVLVVGAPAGTTAIIHPGTCEAIDAALVALVGDVGTTGQAQATIPVSFEALTDGAHVVAFHPGLDTATTVGCGPIPAVARAPASEPPALVTPAPAPDSVAASAPPIATSPPLATEAPLQTADPACLGVPDWITASAARMARISEALSDLSAIAGRYDTPAYLSGLASLEGELQAMIARQAQEPVPVAAGEVNALAITAYETFSDAARQIYDSMTVSADLNSYSRAMGRYEEATKLLGEVQRGIGQLRGTCVTP